MNIIEELQGILKGNRVVWMQPTTFSPACKFVFAPRAAKVLSVCRMWLSPYARERVVSDTARVEKCPFCLSGKRVQQDMSDHNGRGDA